MSPIHWIREQHLYLIDPTGTICAGTGIGVVERRSDGRWECATWRYGVDVCDTEQEAAEALCRELGITCPPIPAQEVPRD